MAKRKRPPSRPQRWTAAAAKAVEGLEALKEVQEEYNEWLENLPENLQYSGLGEKLTAIQDLDVDTALDTASEAEGMDLPLGFGRD